MSNRRFEMYHYRQVLVRMRQGDTDRAIAPRAKLIALTAIAASAGIVWWHIDYRPLAIGVTAGLCGVRIISGSGV